MAEKTNFTFPFAKGINQKPSERAQADGEMRAAENIRISKTGEFNKRSGFEGKDQGVFPSGSPPSNFQACSAYNNELVGFDGEKAYSQYTSQFLKDRGTCTNVRMSKEKVNVDSGSMDGAPAYTTIKNGETGEVYEIFVWESRPLGVNDVESEKGIFANQAVTHNYSNKPSKLLYSVKHKVTGVFLIDAEPIIIDGKDIVDRDLLLGENKVYSDSAGPAGDTAEIMIEGYGTDAGTSNPPREIADVVGSGNQLVLKGVFNSGAAGSAATSLFYVDGAAGSETDADDGHFTQLTGSSVNYRANVLDQRTDGMSAVNAYLNVESGENAPYFTTQPMLFSFGDSDAILVFASQVVANGYGSWGIWQAKFDFEDTDAMAAGITTPTILSSWDSTDFHLNLNFRYPIWDADLCYTKTGAKKGVVFIFNTTEAATPLRVEFLEYASGSLSVGTGKFYRKKVERYGSDAAQVLLLNPIGTSKAMFGGTSVSSWSDAAVPNRVVIKGYNDKAHGSGNPQNDSENLIIYVLRAGSTGDDDIIVYKEALDHNGSAYSTSGATKTPLLKYPGSPDWRLPSDLYNTYDMDSTTGTRSLESFTVVLDSSADRYRCQYATVVNAAISDPKRAGDGDAYVFVEIAAETGGGGTTWRTIEAAGSQDNTNYIQSENRWIIRKNIANETDTKVLGRNINILSDAFQPVDGYKYYFMGHSVFDGDSSTARTALFNEDGEVVGVYAAGESALCHPYELSQMTCGAPLYFNTPMFALRSRINYYNDSAISKIRPGIYPADSPPTFDIAFGISTISNADNSYQFTVGFNPKVAICDFTPPVAYPSEEVAGSLYVGSGLLWSFNGGSFIENGFLQKPLVQKIRIFDSEYTPGATTDAGCTPSEYIIAAAYVYTDNNGVNHYSALDYYGNGANIDPIIVTEDTKKLRVRVAATQLTNKRVNSAPTVVPPGSNSIPIADMNSPECSIALFVSANLQELKGDKTELQQIPLHLYTVQPMKNNTRYYDIDIDSPSQDIQFNGQLTGVPPLIEPAVYPVQPSCPTSLTSHKNTLCVSTTDGMVYPSQSFSSQLGSEQSMVAPCFSVANVVSISEETNGVGISHLQSSGMSLLAFNRNNVYVMMGDGPSAGNRGTFLPPEIALLDQGIEADSICARIPSGVIYKSKHGYHLLGSEGLVFIGSPVEDYNAYSPVGVQVVDETSEVIIPLTLNESITSTTSGGESKELSGTRCLIYNYEFNQWYTWLVPTSLFFISAALAPYINDVQGLIRSDGTRKLYFVTSSGDILAEMVSNYQDKVSIDSGWYPIPMKVKTGQIKIGKFFSGFRLYRIGIPIFEHSATTLTIKLYYDGSSSAAETFTASVPAATDQSEIILKPAKQKCRTIAVEIEEDATSTGFNDRGATLNGLGLLVAPRTVKMPYNVAVSKVPTGS